MPTDGDGTDTRSDREVSAVLIGIHLAAMACGVGAAIRADIVMARSLRSQQVDGRTLRLVGRMSLVVWVSMAVLIGSGSALVLTGSPPTSRFLTKLLVVIVACSNGARIHRAVLPELRRLTTPGQATSLPRQVIERAGSAAGVSVSSWGAAIVLGSWRSLTLGTPVLVSIYLVLVVMASRIGAQCAPRLCPFSDPDRARSDSRTSAGLVNGARALTS